MKFDISTYGIDGGIVDKVVSYLNEKGADVAVDDIVGIGVPEDVAIKIVDDYKASLEGDAGDKEGDTSEEAVEQTEETEQSEGAEQVDGEKEASDGVNGAGSEDGTDGADGESGADDEPATDGAEGADGANGAPATDSDNANTGVEDNTDWKKMYEELLFSNMVADAIRGIEFTSSFAKNGVIDIIRKKNLQIVDGKLEGVSELIDEIKTEYPDAFAPTNKRPIFGRTRGTQSESGTSSAMAYLAQRYKNNPYFKG